MDRNRRSSMESLPKVYLDDDGPTCMVAHYQYGKYVEDVEWRPPIGKPEPPELAVPLPPLTYLHAPSRKTVRLCKRAGVPISREAAERDSVRGYLLEEDYGESSDDDERRGTTDPVSPAKIDPLFCTRYVEDRMPRMKYNEPDQQSPKRPTLTRERQVAVTNDYGRELRLTYFQWLEKRFLRPERMIAWQCNRGATTALLIVITMH